MREYDVPGRPPITGGGADRPRRRRRRRLHSRAVEGGRYLAVYNTYTAVVRVGIVLQCTYIRWYLYIYISLRSVVHIVKEAVRHSGSIFNIILYYIYIVDRLSWVVIKKLRITIDNSTNDCIHGAGSWLDQLNCDKICVYYCIYYFVYNIQEETYNVHTHLTDGVYSPDGRILGR